MQGIKQWALENPTKVNDLLNENERYVFFKVIDDIHDGPVGALNVPLTPRRSIAIDPQIIPLGYPVYLSTTWLILKNPSQTNASARHRQRYKGSLKRRFFLGFWRDFRSICGKNETGRPNVASSS